MAKLRISLLGVVLIGVFAAIGHGPHSHIISHQVGAATLVEDVDAATQPTASESRATEAGFAKLHEMVPQITRISVISFHHSAALLSASDGAGHQLKLHKALNAFVIQVSAVRNDGSGNLTGFIVIDAIDGSVKAASLVGS